MFGFIGAGNMGSAIIKGMLSNSIESSAIYIHTAHEEKMRAMKESLNINIADSNLDIARKSKYIFLAVKPNIYENVLNEIKDELNDDKVLIIMAAGFEIERVKKIVGNKKVVRIMPNTPALVGKGFTVTCFDDLINEEEKNYVLNILGTLGAVKVINESYINAYSAISGSGPAFVFMIIEAMADAAVLMGIPRSDAYKVVEYTIAGSAELAIGTGKHPGELKDMVCSPGGTTIEGVRTLEENGLRSSLIECIINTYKKNFDLSKIR